LWRYGAGSVVAFVTSGVALFVCIQWLGLGATTGAVIAFFAGAVPNWVLNRRWAWQKRHRDGIGKETSLYTVVSLVSLGVSVAATKATAVAAEHMGSHNTFKHLLVTGVYLLVTIALAGAKYVVYDRWVFVDRRDRSRHQVPTTTDVNRTP
jgi:putative flippase GtrA